MAKLQLSPEDEAAFAQVTKTWAELVASPRTASDTLRATKLLESFIASKLYQQIMLQLEGALSPPIISPEQEDLLISAQYFLGNKSKRLDLKSQVARELEAQVDAKALAEVLHKIMSKAKGHLLCAKPPQPYGRKQVSNLNWDEFLASVGHTS